jgi:CRP-like cAMP-binding protein
MFDLLIACISTYIDLTDNDKTFIRRLFHQQHLEPGAHFLFAGDICHDVAYLADGLVRYYVNHEGEALTYTFAKNGDFVCDYPSFLHAQPSHNNIEALKPTTLLTISFDELQQFYRKVQHGERFGRLVAEQIFTQVLDQLTSFYRDSPSVRYEHFLRQFPDLAEQLPQYYIASYVGVKPQSLSRIRRRRSFQP